MAAAGFRLGEWRRRTRRMTAMDGLGRLARPAPRLLIAPQDIRTSDPSIAGDIYAGLFALGGRAMQVEGISVFEVEPPSWLWASELHGFAWLRHLAVTQNALSRANARSLLVQWIARPGRKRRSIADEPLTAARRLISLLSQSPLLLEEADAVFYRRFMRLLAREAAGVLAHHRTGGPQARLASAVALAYYGVCTEQPPALAARLDALLGRALDAAVLPDGGHVSRNPQAVLDLLLDLLPLRQGYIARRTPPPQSLLGAVDRMMPMLRLLRHGDGALALFNGMGVTAPDLVAAALAYDDSRGQALTTAPHVGYQRLADGPALVIADCGLPAAEPSPVHPHAGTLAFEFSDGPQRLVISCGSPAPDRESLMRAARATAAHSTLVLDDRSSARFFEHRDRYGRLLAGVIGGPRAVEVNRQGGSAALVAVQDGYARSFGLLHERRLSLESGGDTLTGIDRLLPARSKPPAPVPFAIRFHLHPTVTASRQAGGRSVLLIAARRVAWLFEAEGAAVDIDESVLFASLGGSRRSQQIVLSGKAEAGLEVRWRFRRVVLEQRPAAAAGEAAAAEPDLPFA